MNTYESKYVCPWCGEVDLSDKETEDRLISKENLGHCPKCKRFSYSASIKAKFLARGENWKGFYRSVVNPTNPDQQE